METHCLGVGQNILSVVHSGDHYFTHTSVSQTRLQLSAGLHSCLFRFPCVLCAYANMINFDIFDMFCVDSMNTFQIRIQLCLQELGQTAP